MTDFDLSSPETRILECGRCDEPVCAEGFSGRVKLVCGYCGFEDARELTASRETSSEDADPYRDRNGGRRAGHTLIRANLDEPPRGLKLAPLKTLRPQLLALKRAPLDAQDDGEARVHREHSIVWLAATVGALQIRKRDFLRGRATYETALELVTLPAYRALMLTRLSRLASLSNATELAEKWLRAVPATLRIPEIASEVKVSRAMLARSHQDPNAVLQLLGSRDSIDADEHVGPARWLALALRVDALEMRGDQRAARTLWRRAALSGPLKLGGAAATLGLAPKTRQHAIRRAYLLLPLLLVTIALLIDLLWRIARDQPLDPVRVIAAFAGFGVVLLLRRF